MSENSKVYFTDFRARPGLNIPQKLKMLIKKAGIENIDFNNKFVAIKIHFGEPGNLAFLRPNYAKAVADVVRELGGRPFLTDANTLYVGRRKNALDHIDAAYENGFTPYSTGCQVIIADGLKGTDETLVPINGEYVKEAKIGRAVMDADIIISLNHFKGHEATGFGGAIKNLGMGCGSRAGKMEMHYSGKPVVKDSKCKKCKICAKICAHDAISYNESTGIAEIDHNKCVGCGRCIGMCNFDAISPANNSANDLLNKKMAEYALAVVKGRPEFHINIICDVSPNCDCHSENDAPIVPNVGMLASFDSVAIDRASADLVNEQTAFMNSALGENIERHVCEKDNFHTNHPDTNWESQIEHGEKIGLGTSKYELIKVKF
ncbi:MAG: DUF362 domain-containing protein [Clostridia bacterium]|nr:DUF362 domain-containing protein [Clostridia bacterium]